MYEFWRVILSSTSSQKMNTEEKNQYVQKELSETAISREEKDHHEYNVCICNYPKHPNLAQYDPLSLNIDYMLGV